MFEKFMDNGGQLQIDQSAVTVRLKKKRHLPPVADGSGAVSKPAYILDGESEISGSGRHEFLVPLQKWAFKNNFIL